MTNQELVNKLSHAPTHLVTIRLNNGDNVVVRHREHAWMLSDNGDTLIVFDEGSKEWWIEVINISAITEEPMPSAQKKSA